MAKITSIKSQKRSGRVNIFLDGEFAFGLPTELLVDLDLHKGKELSDAEVHDLENQSNQSKIMDAAYRFISYRPRSKKEVRDRLLKKYTEEEVETAITKLDSKGYLNDADFARFWVENRGLSRGARLLKHELRRKGVANEIIEEALAEITEDKELHAALELIEKKRSFANLDKAEAYKKIAPFLARRGYGYNTIKAVITELYK